MKSLFTLLLLMIGAISHAQDLANINLAAYLYEHGANIDEGHVTPLQKSEFIKVLRKSHPIKTILEIGFNAGHSSEFFLEETKCEKLVSFDINIHPYMDIGREFITNKFGDRFTLIEGDSTIQVPLYADSHSDESFDLIFIDGGHSFNCCFSDILNCSRLAHSETIVIIDDYVSEVKTAVDACVLMKLISIVDYKFIRDDVLGDRIWVLVKYLKS